MNLQLRLGHNPTAGEMKILYFVLTLLLVVAIVYRHVVSHSRTRKDRILESRTILTFFQNDGNFAAYRVLESVLERRPLSVRLFWRINGQGQNADVSAPVVSMFYVSEMKRIVLVTFQGVYLYDPHTAQKEELDIDPNCTFLLCTRIPDDANLILLGYQSGDKVLKYICVYLDLITRKSHLFEIKGDLRGTCRTAKGEYYVKTTEYLYKITPSLIEPYESYNDGKADLWLVDGWQNDELVLCQQMQNHMTTLIWDGVELEFNRLFSALISGDYLWVIDNNDDNNKFHLTVYDYLGHVSKNFQLRQRVSGCGKMHEGGIWVFYSDASVDVFGKDGERVSTEYLDIRL